MLPPDNTGGRLASGRLLPKFWVELRCDAMTSPKCMSTRNAGESIMGWARDTEGLKRLTEAAVKQGWKVRRDNGRAVCPKCKNEDRQTGC